ncbi:hypothetical protein TraAM80_07992 [Trypanosoma rangeli]|uniref:Transmembrane protein n=1 Tax=Trypanosoma rangeli TaxID=5698 RepID=A0A3R7NB28_TRYRA|nr:uncharacterized protein TraAM80_07992 [Trypanosoma rangeli]RNE99800.1 hypothetical protein TraAM80_07992 [Trypanosoma rangeli]|eukprot:RNE99800.1 hypothetical protein TraAM80_07992 [Trypanosoma rangeli]
MSERAEQSIPPGSDSCVTAPPIASQATASIALRDSSHVSPLESTWGRAMLSNTCQSAAALPLTSTAVVRSNFSNAHSRRKGAAMTLYVRAPSAENKEFGSREEMKEEKREDAQEEGTLSLAEGEDAGSRLTPVFNVLQMGTTAAGAVKDLFSGFVNLSRRGRSFTGLLVFIFFMVMFIFLLHVAERRIQWVSRVVTYYNEQNLIVAASLTEQLLEKANELNELMKPFKQTPGDVLEKATMALEEMTEVRDASVKQLHSLMFYPGPVDDIKFLLEEHVAYKMNLARMIKEELQWLDDNKQEALVHRTYPSEGVAGRKRSATDGRKKHEKKYEDASRHQQGDPTRGYASQPWIEGTMLEKVKETTGAGKERFSSHLLGRVSAVLVLFLLTVLYIRL